MSAQDRSLSSEVRCADLLELARVLRCYTHRFPLAEFDKVMDLITHGECGKVLLLP